MDAEIRKTVLRMIPYGLYVLTVENSSGDVSGATVNWVTQASFQPPLLVVALKADSHAYQLVSEVGKFVLNVLGKGQGELAYKFFKPVVKEGNTLSGEPYRIGQVGAPILENAPAYIECKVIERIEKGDHVVVLAEVVDVGLKHPLEGRPDDATLWLRDLGEKVFYGG